jgi:acyl carrier protein
MCLFEVVAKVLKQPVVNVTEATSQKTVGAWDSMRHIELVLALEDEYGVVFPPAEVSTMTSVAAIRKLLLQKGVDV